MNQIQAISVKYVSRNQKAGFLYHPLKTKTHWVWVKGEQVTSHHGQHTNVLAEVLEEATEEYGCPVLNLRHNDPVHSFHVREITEGKLADPVWFDHLSEEQQELVAEIIAPLFRN